MVEMLLCDVEDALYSTMSLADNKLCHQQWCQMDNKVCSGKSQTHAKKGFINCARPVNFLQEPNLRSEMEICQTETESRGGCN